MPHIISFYSIRHFYGSRFLWCYYQTLYIVFELLSVTQRIQDELKEKVMRYAEVRSQSSMHSRTCWTWIQVDMMYTWLRTNGCNHLTLSEHERHYIMDAISIYDRLKGESTQGLDWDLFEHQLRLEVLPIAGASSHIANDFTPRNLLGNPIVLPPSIPSQEQTFASRASVSSGDDHSPSGESTDSMEFFLRWAKCPSNHNSPSSSPTVLDDSITQFSADPTLDTCFDFFLSPTSEYEADDPDLLYDTIESDEPESA